MGQYDWLALLPAKTVYTVFDTETTGLDPATNRVVEIGALQFDSQGLRARFSTLINPQRPMPAEASRVNGITDAMLAKEPVITDVLDDFLAFIGDTILIAHNAPFDISFINHELGRNSRKPLTNKVVDTRILAKEVFPGLPKYALQDLAVHFKIQALDAHRAEDDARVCMELFKVCAEKIGVGKAAQVAELAAAAAATEDLFSPKPQQSVKPSAPKTNQDLFDESDDDFDFASGEDWDEESAE